jgi:hypothetical protein
VQSNLSNLVRRRPLARGGEGKCPVKRTEPLRDSVCHDRQKAVGASQHVLGVVLKSGVTRRVVSGGTSTRVMGQHREHSQLHSAEQHHATSGTVEDVSEQEVKLASQHHVGSVENRQRVFKQQLIQL